MCGNYGVNPPRLGVRPRKYRMTKLYYCVVTYHHDQRDYALLPEPTMEWGNKILQNRIQWGDLDIFYEHHAGEMSEWAVNNVKLWHYPTSFIKCYEVILMNKRDWNCETFEVNLPDMFQNDIIELVENFFALNSKDYEFDCETISIREI